MEEFLDLLDITGSFIAIQQSTFQNKISPQHKYTLCDFAKNYSLILQDEV
jgi:hypothetical protein